jgi:hypothetical protein
MSVVSVKGKAQGLQDSQDLYRCLDDCINEIPSSHISAFKITKAAEEAINNGGVVIMSDDYGCRIYMNRIDRPINIFGHEHMVKWHSSLPSSQRDAISIEEDDVEDGEVYSVIIKIADVEHYFEF